MEQDNKNGFQFSETHFCLLRFSFWGLVAAATAAAASTTAAAFSTTAAAAAFSATAATAAAASAGKHGIVNHKSDLSSEILYVINGGFFQEGSAVRIHEEFDSLHGQHGVVSLGLIFHGQHILKAARFGRYRHYPQRPISFTLFFHNFLELLYSESCNFHCLFSSGVCVGKISGHI
jgi:hypothetical protein